VRIRFALSMSFGVIFLPVWAIAASAQAPFPDAGPPALLEGVAPPSAPLSARKPPRATPKPAFAEAKPSPAASKPKPQQVAPKPSPTASANSGVWSDPATEQARLAAWRSYYAMRSVASSDTSAWFDLQKMRSTFAFWLAVALVSLGGLIAIVALAGGLAFPQETRSVLSFGPTSLNLSATAIGLILFCLTGLLLNATFWQPATAPAGTSTQTPAASPSTPATTASPAGR